MDRREKVLYHQIHPVKLATDIGVTGPLLFFLWNGQILPAFLVTLPSAVASALVMRYADLERIKASRAGAYVSRHMSRAVQAVRALGLVVMMVGAWYQTAWPIAAGLVIILVAWFYGLLPRGTAAASP